MQVKVVQRENGEWAVDLDLSSGPAYHRLTRILPYWCLEDLVWHLNVALCDEPHFRLVIEK